MNIQILRIAHFYCFALYILNFSYGVSVWRTERGKEDKARARLSMCCASLMWCKIYGSNVCLSLRLCELCTDQLCPSTQSVVSYSNSSPCFREHEMPHSHIYTTNPSSRRRKTVISNCVVSDDKDLDIEKALM